MRNKKTAVQVDLIIYHPHIKIHNLRSIDLAVFKLNDPGLRTFVRCDR